MLTKTPSLLNRMRLAAIALVGVAAAASLVVLDRQRHQEVLGHRTVEMEEGLRLAGSQILHRIDILRQDARFLARTPPIAGIVRATLNGGIDPRDGNSTAVWMKRLEEIFCAFVEAHPDYFMVRYIGLADGGRELLRVELRGNRIEVVPDERLQHKGDRDFVVETARLADGEIFLSALDLERDEQGLWEPHRPVLRAATPVRTPTGEVFGVVVVNLEGRVLLNAAGDLPADVKADTASYLADEAGRILLHPDSRRMFAFESGERAVRLDEELPALAPLLKAGGPSRLPLTALDLPGGVQYGVASRLHFDPRRPERFLLLAALLPQAAIDADMAPHRRDLLLSALGISLLASTLLFFAIRRLLRPLEEVTGAARAIAAGGREVALPAGGTVEIRQLTDAFRRMLEQVASREQELRSLNAGLEERVRERTGRLRLSASVFENTSEGVLVADVESRIVSVNKAFTEITGYTAEEAIGQRTNLLKSDHHEPSFYLGMWQAIEANGFWQGEIWNRRKGGEVYLEWLVINRIPAENGFPVNYVAVFHDITEQRRKDEHIRHLAFHDPLTGLPNRSLFQDRLQHAIGRARREEAQLSVTFIDLDGFKGVNDSLGHDVGDLLLQEVATRIRRRMRRETDTVARLGGDEFVVLVEDLRDPEECACLAGEIIADISESMELRGQTVRVGASLGIAFFPEDGCEALELMQRADTAMYAAKAAGKGGYRFFRPAMLAAVSRRLALETELRQAIEGGLLVLHYQPKVGIPEGNLRGVEALVRWNHPQRGLIAPDEFIGVAEETGLILPLGDWVLEEACRQAAEWRAQGRAISIAVNVSARQIAQGELAERLGRLLIRYRLPPEALEVELTETALMSDPEVAARTLAQLRGMGLTIAVDDFGTGYSSLSRLRRLPIDLLKIDRTFVMNADRDEKDAQVVRTVIALAKGLGLDVVAEGVETADQAELLHTSGCNICQGFHYGAPVPAGELESWFG